MDALKDIGRPVWLALMVLGFIWFWPVGLGILAYLAWSGQIGIKGAGMPWSPAFWSSGNKAFDKHQAEARAALDAEREMFGKFLDERLDAEQRAEFEAFKAKQKAA